MKKCILVPLLLSALCSFTAQAGQSLQSDCTGEDDIYNQNVNILQINAFEYDKDSIPPLYSIEFNAIVLWSEYKRFFTVNAESAGHIGQMAVVAKMLDQPVNVCFDFSKGELLGIEFS